ncbi:MAG: SDR family oxidoreductase [Fimbriimonadaceae bacterium]|nr:SDR family oxidoreductase [Alphaproteobacteria bacterium]
MNDRIDKSLKGKHAVITGGGRGIGAAIASSLAARDVNLTIMGRNLETLQDTAKSLMQDFSVAVSSVSLDVSSESAVEKAFSSLDPALGPVDILVNNAGYAPAAPFHRISLADWKQVIDVDLTGAFLCTRMVLPGMIERGFGRVVNIASTAGLKGYAYVTSYCAAKHGMIGLTRALALETAKTGVTVNAVCPGYTDTDIVTASIENIVAKTGKSSDDAMANLVSNNPQQRLINPMEVAETVAWLCLPASSAMTGQSIAVAGGEVM